MRNLEVGGDVKLDTTSRIEAAQSHEILILWYVFIGPRYTWGPIYGSESLSTNEVAPSGGQFCN